MSHVARHWRRLDDGRVRCELCPRRCELAEGQRGVCFVRANEAGRLVSTTYGRSSGFCVDPIEKKPLNHFLPGTAVLSFGTAGCNMLCRFCQNWDMSKAREMDILCEQAAPEAIARAAAELGCHAVAYTYNDPAVFLEYAVDTALACRERGLRNVAVTAGYLEPAPREELFAHMDAANIDLKAFDEGFYRTLTGAELGPVLETIEYVAGETDTWLELTTLVIPGENDSEAELEALSAWVAERLGPDVPLHFSAFHPDFRMLDHPPTPPDTLRRAREIARAAGLRHVYLGNVRDPEGDTTRCPACGEALIERDWYQLRSWNLDERGRCARCGTPLAGVFEPRPGSWGPRALRVDLAQFAE